MSLKNTLLILVSFQFIFSCQNKVIEPITQHTGEEIFSSIYFLSGKTVDQLKELSEIRQELKQYNIESKYKDHMKTIMELVKSKILEENPHYFEWYELQMTSGDHLVIRNAFDRTQQILNDVSNKIFEDQISLISNQIASGDLEYEESFKQLGLQINSFRNDPDKLKKYLFSNFLDETKMVSLNSRNTCLALVVVLYVIAGGAFDLAISQNVVIGMNYAIAAYTYIASTGDTGKTIMFFNAGVISPPDKRILGYKTQKNLRNEMFIDEIAKKLAR